MAHYPGKTSQTNTLAELLTRHLAQVGWSERQLAARADIPRGTIRNWCKGVVARPREWQQLVRAASALRLNTEQANELLQVTGHVPLSELQILAHEEVDKQLLLPWLEESSAAVPFQVIPDLPYFVGREAEIAALKRQLVQETQANLCVINGMAGVGKTSLVAHLAYEVRDHFSDGVLWVRVDISDTMSLLKLLADSYGQDVSRYTDLQSRSQVVRSLLAHKKALLILDNVESSKQIEPLLPPTGSCATLITTRHTNLRITRGHPHIQLTPFERTSQSSPDLFTRILGAELVKTEQKTLAAIADLLGHLPLALAIVAGRIAYEPHATPGDTLAQLQQEKGRLNALTHEDQSVQASLNASYGALSLHEQQFFAALGLFVGEDFSLEAVTAVTDVTTAVCRSNLSRLAGLSLVQVGKNKRYQLHPLLREYARLKISDVTIYDRMIAYYADFVAENRDNYRVLGEELDNIVGALNLAFAREKMITSIKLTIDISQFMMINGLQELAGSLLQRAEQAAVGENSLGHLALIKSALGRIEAERDLHLAETYFKEGLTLAYDSQDEKIIASTLKDLGMFHHGQQNYEEAEMYWQKSLLLTRETQQYKLAGYLTNYLASIALNHLGDYRKAEKLHLEGLVLQRQHNNLPALAVQLMNLSMIAYCLGDYDQSEAYIHESAAIAQQIGYALVNIILTRRRAELFIAQRGDYARARDSLLEGEQAARELGRQEVIAFILSNLGKVTAQLGDVNRAGVYLEEARQLSVRTRRRDIEIECWTNLGFAAAQTKDLQTAVFYFQKALSLARTERDVWFLCEVLELYGEYRLTRGQFDPAHDLFSELLDISRQSELAAMVGLAQFGLAQVAWGKGNVVEAQRVGKKSQSLLAKIGHYEAERVATWLQRCGDMKPVEYPFIAVREGLAQNANRLQHP